MIRKLQHGFTITELVIAMSVATIVSGVILTVVIVFYGNILRSDSLSRMTVDSQIILRNVVDELRIGSAVLTTNANPDANEPGGGWQTSNDSAILIISTPAATTGGDFIFDPSTGEYFQNEIVYFADGDTLYRRVLENTNASGNTAVTTCPKPLSSPTCPPDSILSEDYEDMTFTFYDQDNQVTADPTRARSVAVNINLSRGVFGETVSARNSIRVTLRN